MGPTVFTHPLAPDVLTVWGLGPVSWLSSLLSFNSAHLSHPRPSVQEAIFLWLWAEKSESGEVSLSPSPQTGLSPALLVNAPWEKITNNMSAVRSVLISIIFLSLGCYRYNLGPACSKQRFPLSYIPGPAIFFKGPFVSFETRSHFVTQYVAQAGSTVMAIF